MKATCSANSSSANKQANNHGQTSIFLINNSIRMSVVIAVVLRYGHPYT